MDLISKDWKTKSCNSLCEWEAKRVKGKTHKSTKTNQSTTGKLGKPQLPWLGTSISKERVGWINLLILNPFWNILYIYHMKLLLFHLTNALAAATDNVL
jgi:hypothetical protein